MYINEYFEITLTHYSQPVRWETKLGYKPKLNEPIKLHWTLLKSTSYREMYIQIKCDECETIYKKRIKHLNDEEYHLCKSCIQKGDRNYMYGKKKSESLALIHKKFLEEKGNPFTWESVKEKIKEKKPWIKTAIKNTGQTRNEEIKKKMSESALNAFKNGTRKPSSGWGVVKTRKYKDIDYQSTYELKFLKYLESIDKLNLIERGPVISFISNDGRTHSYFIDYKIKNTNCVIEIKSTYIWNKNNEVNLLKKQFAELEYDYYLILDNKFNNIQEIIKKYE